MYHMSACISLCKFIFQYVIFLFTKVENIFFYLFIFNFMSPISSFFSVEALSVTNLFLGILNCYQNESAISPFQL